MDLKNWNGQKNRYLYIALGCLGGNLEGKGQHTLRFHAQSFRGRRSFCRRLTHIQYRLQPVRTCPTGQLHVPHRDISFYCAWRAPHTYTQSTLKTNMNNILYMTLMLVWESKVSLYLHWVNLDRWKANLIIFFKICRIRICQRSILITYLQSWTAYLDDKGRLQRCENRHSAGRYNPRTVWHWTQLHFSLPSRTPHVYPSARFYQTAGQAQN